MSFSQELPQRRHPAHGVIHLADQATIVFITVCTRRRQPWLARDAVHQLLRKTWTEARAWSVGRYVIMPDHVHLFAAPTEPYLGLDSWIQYWKSIFSKGHQRVDHRWQSDHWDRRLRGEESYDDAWEYVVNNPVRHGLVARAEDWPYQGTICELPWR